MKMLLKTLQFLVTVALILPAPVFARDRDTWHRDHNHHRNGDDTAAGVALGIGLLGIAAAVAAKKRQRQQDRRDAYRDGYGGSYGGDIYSPSPDVNCYRGERRCYVRGQFSYSWTESQFAYDPYRRGY